MPFFKSSKSPQDIVKSTKEAIAVLEKGDGTGKKAEKAIEDVGKGLVSMKQILYGTQDAEPQAEAIAQLAQEVYTANLLFALITSLSRIDFEARKDAAQIFSNLLRRQIGTRMPTVEHIGSRPDLLLALVRGYEDPTVALICGTMLRECLRHESLAHTVLRDPIFYTFFSFIELPTFDIASDAFSSFRDLLTKHKMLVAEFLEENYDRVFSHYERLLHSDNYVTKRQSLKLLGELLLDRHNFTSMTKFISSVDNLKLMMTLLRDKSKNIQYEAFHVFKVFVANPNKSKQIMDILLKNQEKLVDFLGKFHADRSEDEQFNDEKSYLIKQIQELRPS